MNDTFRYTLIPVILGANPRARLWAERIMWRFRVRSYVLGENYHPALLLSFALRYRKLCGNRSYSAFILSDLIRFTQDHPDKLLVLIGTTAYYSTLIRENKAELEKYYILSDPELSFLVREETSNPQYYVRGERA